MKPCSSSYLLWQECYVINNHKTTVVFNNNNLLLINMGLAGDANMLGDWLVDLGSFGLG